MIQQGTTGSLAWRSGLAALVGGAVVLISIASIVWPSADERRATAKIEAAIADLQAAGLPVDEPTLTRFHQQLASREHTVQWLRALGEIESPAFVQSAKGMPYLGDGAAVPLPGKPWPVQQEVESFLAAHQPLLEQLHHLSQESGPTWLPIDFDGGDAHRQAIREAARLLLLELYATAYRGDDEQVLLGLKSLLSLADTLSGDPLMSHQLVCISLHGVAMSAMQFSLEQGLLDLGDEEVVASLMRHLDRFEDFAESYRVAHLGDRAYVLADYREPTRFSDSRFLNAETPAQDALVWLEFFRRNEQVAKQKELDLFVQASARLDEEMRTKLSELPEWDVPGWWSLSASTVSRASVALAKALARQVMHARMAKLAVGLGAYQHRFGAWPDELGELSKVGINPDALVPLGDRPFGYRVEGDTALLWGFEPTVGQLPRDVSADPPPLDSWDAGINQSWIWRIPPTQP